MLGAVGWGGEGPAEPSRLAAVGGGGGGKGSRGGVKGAFGNKMATSFPRAKWRRAGGGASDRVCAEGGGAGPGRRGGAGVRRAGGGRGAHARWGGRRPRCAAAAPRPAGGAAPGEGRGGVGCGTPHRPAGARVVRERAVRGGVITRLKFPARREGLSRGTDGGCVAFAGQNGVRRGKALCRRTEF